MRKYYKETYGPDNSYAGIWYVENDKWYYRYHSMNNFEPYKNNVLPDKVKRYKDTWTELTREEAFIELL